MKRKLRLLNYLKTLNIIVKSCENEVKFDERNINEIDEQQLNNDVRILHIICGKHVA